MGFEEIFGIGGESRRNREGRIGRELGCVDGTMIRVNRAAVGLEKKLI